MKKLLTLAASVLLLPIGAMAQTPAPAATIPTITLATAAGILGGKATIIGTAKGVSTTTGTGTTAVTSVSRVAHVYYQREGENKIRKAKLASKGSDVTWLVDVKSLPTTGRRYTFWVVDSAGNESDVIGRRFKKTS